MLWGLSVGTSIVRFNRYFLSLIVGGKWLLEKAYGILSSRCGLEHPCSLPRGRARQTLGVQADR